MPTLSDRDKRVHCVTREPIPQLSGVAHKPACEPGEPPGDPYRFRCRYPFPRYIHVAWSTSDDRPSWLPQAAIPPNPFDNLATTTTTTVVPSGEDPSVLSLSFRLNDAIANEYYDLAKQSSPATYDPFFSSLEPDLYSLESAIFGKTLNVTTTTLLQILYTGQPWVFPPPSLGSVLCQETLTDTCQLRQVITGAIAVKCNRFYYNANGEPEFPVYPGYNPNVLVEVNGVIAAGLATVDIVNNPKKDVTHIVLAGLLPYNGTPARCIIPGPPNLGIGWPRYGRADFSGKILLNRQTQDVTGSAIHGFHPNMGGATVNFSLSFA